MRILLIEEFKLMCLALKRELERHGFVVEVAPDNAAGSVMVEQGKFDAVILDLWPPHDGVSLLKRWRRKGVNVHVLFLTGGEDVEIKLGSAGLGADGYLVKPFGFEELLARLPPLIRPDHNGRNHILRIHDLEIDTRAYTGERGGRPIRLTPREYSLLEFLARHRGTAIKRSEICQYLYEGRGRHASNIVDVYIHRLRQKIDKNSSFPLILSRRGKGYMLRADAAEERG